MDEAKARNLRVAGATLLALVLLPVGWYAVAALFLWAGRAMGGGAEPLETLIRISWFVAPPVAAFIALWAAGTLVRVPLREVFILFCGFVGVMFVMAFLGLYLGGGMTETPFVIGMFAQLALVLMGAWAGRRAVERGRF